MVLASPTMEKDWEGFLRLFTEYRNIMSNAKIQMTNECQMTKCQSFDPDGHRGSGQEDFSSFILLFKIWVSFEL